MTQQSHLKYWLALNRLRGLSVRDIQKVVACADDLEQFFKELAYGHVSTALKEQAQQLNWKEIDLELQWAAEKDHHIITIFDESYPACLKEISSPPLLLYVKGDLSLLQAPAVAMVGSRNPTPVGLQTARHFAAFLAERGLVVVSGLALGIDAASHEGALTSGKTLAVLGSGLCHLYPKRNEKLAMRIAEEGALVSEFPLYAEPTRLSFPQRNRIVSGLSLGTLVVEAALRSGSLITARYALEQGREVFAIPGSIHHALAKGAHYLIKSGAKLVESGEDILEELEGVLRKNNQLAVLQVAQDLKTAEKVQKGVDFSRLGGEYRKVLNSIGYEMTAIDTILNLTGLAPNRLSSLLLKLELNGYIQSLPGGVMRIKS